jgi:uncharacterized protein (TIGR02145 family)
MRTNCTIHQQLAVAVGLIIVIFCLAGCQKDEEPAPPVQTTVLIADTVIFVDTVAVPPDAVADVEGTIYPTVVINSQRWMAENLRTHHYSNGDPVPYVPDLTQWAGLTTGAWSHYDADAAYDGLFGKLYNWYAVNDPRNVCPTGWHVPTDEDWMDLEEAMGVPVPDLDNNGMRGAAANAGGQLKATALWTSPNLGANDSIGFSAYPGGFRSTSGTFGELQYRGYWWSASEQSATDAWMRGLWWNDTGIYRVYVPKTTGGSVRCVED